jgi:hypothetical protein
MGVPGDLAFERIADQANTHGITCPHAFASMACRNSKASNVMNIGATARAIKEAAGYSASRRPTVS